MYILCVLLLTCCFHNVYLSGSTCIFEGGQYDLSSLKWLKGWPVLVSEQNGIKGHFQINLCQPILSSTGCINSSICLITNNKSISYGDSIRKDSTNYAFANNVQGGFSLFVSTKTRCHSDAVYRAAINFACGPNLGAPELILHSECQANFYWKTSAACSVKPKSKQVPCYVIDENGNKRDLSPLIKQTGGYTVNTPSPEIDLIINVCSTIINDNKTQNCPSDSAACRIKGDQQILFGSVNRRVLNTTEGLVLTYPSYEFYMKPLDGCRLKPKTSITFKCPARGHSQPPKLISDSNCQYDIEWETEYACPETTLKGNIKDCKFSVESHGIAIDLSPLKGKSINNVKSSYNNNISFDLSICSGLNQTCENKSWRSLSVCMTDTSTNSSLVVGKTEGTDFIYADQEVSLTYSKGSLCEDDLLYSSTINFVCDKEVDNGEPKHISSNHCTHIFEWRTKHACLTNPLDTPCSVTFDKKKYDLEKLLLTKGAPWEAIDRRSLPSKDNAEYYINVCGQLSNFGNLSSCGTGSSACVLLYNGTYLNIGNFSMSPTYDEASNTVKLHYIGGSYCKDSKQWSSTIEFICRPGHIDSEPVLTRINDEDCIYEFEWLTAEACPEGIIEGNDCKVYDKNLGIDYDLTSLKSKVYIVDTESYKFYLGICEPVSDSPCSASKNSSDVGVCQVDKVNNTVWKTGEPTSHLSYFDGVVNLTYLSGDIYGDNENKTARLTIIIFICDYNTISSKPYFVEVAEFAYIFHWYTHLVCPHVPSVECLAHDPVSHLIYDLSALSLSSQNWMTIVNDDGEERQIYINICRSLTRPTGCNSNAAACVVKTSDIGEKVVVSNLGQVNGPPVLDSSGHLTLTYTNGDSCRAFGENITYSTVIHFLCEEKSSRSGPIFLSKLGACEYAFLWTTKAACPTSSLEAKEKCQLTDPDSGFTFDLTPLYMDKHPYIAASPNLTYQLNICGKIIDGCTPYKDKIPSKNVSVCQTDYNGNIISEIAVSDGYKLIYSAGQDLSLTYYYNSSESSVLKGAIITFPCTSGAPDQTPTLINEEEGLYFFQMKTRLTCIPSHFDCNALDSFGNEYDLSPLVKLNENWKAVDHRVEYKHLRYYINFCRPLNKINYYSCPGGSSSACQANTAQIGGKGFDLGSQKSAPLVSNKGTVVVRYVNGSICQNGRFRRSTTINLFCSDNEGDLKFIGETPECEFVFSLDTPAACPLQSSKGGNCMVTDPVFGYMFDLNPLKSKNYNYNVSVGEYVYTFNVCDKLNEIQNSCINSSACQSKPSNPTFSKSLGLPNDTLVYRKGVITLDYTFGSGNCHGKYNRSTKIAFTCHHGNENKDGPSFVSEIEDCTYLFDWPTVHACPPFDVIECSVIDTNGTYYDLAPLSLLSDNYHVKYPFSEKNTFVINVCRSVVHTPDSLCPYTSATCLVNNSKSSLPLNLGRAQHAPYIEDGILKMKYTSGDPCNEEHTNTARFLQTIIQFSCDKQNSQHGPTFIGKDDCTYFFDWPTTYACPVKSVPIKTDCTALDPNTGYLYNFTELKNHGLFTADFANYKFYLSVCGNNSYSPCGNHTGLCQEEKLGEKRHFSGGLPNGNLMLNGEGVLFLNYSGGDPCHGDQYKRNTIIEFTCGTSTGLPQFMYETHDCTYYFSWKTEFACQISHHCVAKNGSQYIDLTSLSTTYHIAASSVLSDQSSYYISVCSPLPNVPGIFCPPGSGICRVTTNETTAKNVWQDLGRVEQAPFIDFAGHVTVIYTKGSICLTDKKLTNRARIVFVCDSEVGMGEPVMIEHEFDDCFFLFEWRTSVVCPALPEEKSSFCQYVDDSKGIHFDLSLLAKATQPYYSFENIQTASAYFLNVCSPLRNMTSCEGAGICVQHFNTSENFGLASSQHFSYDGRRLRLAYFDGDDCPSGYKSHKSSEIFFVCDPNAGLGRPMLHKKYTCLAVFMWKTALVCRNSQQQCSFEIFNNHYDFNLLTSLSHNWVTKDVQNNSYWINLCRGVQTTNDTTGCSRTAAICMRDLSGSYISLGTVQTMDAKPINSTDLLLTFQSADTKACSYIASSIPLSPTTRIFMRCGKYLGNPKMFSKPDDECFYDFLWESSLACADKPEQIGLEEDGIIHDPRYGFSINIKSILDTTFVANGTSNSDSYSYFINLSGVHLDSPDCEEAAICQVKSDRSFYRDIGSIKSRIFIARGNELHLKFVSHTKPCGKNKSKNVTTLINMQCSSSAKQGNPTFLYESGDCDYVFEWQTEAACPKFDRDGNNDNHGGDSKDSNIVPNHYREEATTSSHVTEITLGVIVAAVVVAVVVFFIVKPERRTRVYHRFRNLFGGVKLPYFRYKRCTGERLILVDAAQPYQFDDDRDVEMLS